MFDKKAKMTSFNLGDMVLKWDARHEDKESTENSMSYGRVPFPSLPMQEGMHSSSRIPKEIKPEVDLSMAGF